MTPFNLQHNYLVIRNVNCLSLIISYDGNMLSLCVTIFQFFSLLMAVQLTEWTLKYNIDMVYITNMCCNYGVGSWLRELASIIA